MEYSGGKWPRDGKEVKIEGKDNHNNNNHEVGNDNKNGYEVGTEDETDLIQAPGQVEMRHDEWCVEDEGEGESEYWDEEKERCFSDQEAVSKGREDFHNNSNNNKYNCGTSDAASPISYIV